MSGIILQKRHIGVRTIKVLETVCVSCVPSGVANMFVINERVDGLRVIVGKIVVESAHNREVKTLVVIGFVVECDVQATPDDLSSGYVRSYPAMSVREGLFAEFMSANPGVKLLEQIPGIPVERLDWTKVQS
jgi:hypothetical protein